MNLVRPEATEPGRHGLHPVTHHHPVHLATRRVRQPPGRGRRFEGGSSKLAVTLLGEEEYVLCHAHPPQMTFASSRRSDRSLAAASS